MELRAGVIDVAEAPGPGVNLVGFLEAESGLGEIARRLARAVERSDLPLAAISYERTPSRQQHPLELETSSRASYDTNILCLNANELLDFLAWEGVGLFARRYSIGVWFWETSVFRTRDRLAFRLVDEVWAPSRYVRDAVQRKADIPVLVPPIPVEAPPEPVIARQDLGLPEGGFLFLFLFDFVSGERKNPRAVVNAFAKAFAAGEGPSLVLKSINGRERKPSQLAELQAAIGGRPDVVVLDGYVSPSERDAYVAACDCFVSLHRSEGYGLTMAEAMAHGKPVIATGYSGNLEFMTDENSYLVPYRLAPVPDDWWAYAPGAEWAEPDVDAAASLMRRVWEHQDEARALGARARDELLERCSLRRTAEFVENRVSAGRARAAVRARASHDVRLPILEMSRELARPVGAGLAARGTAPTALLRRLLRKALWPHLEERRRFESSVVDGFSALQRSLESCEQRILRLEQAVGPAGDDDAQVASQPSSLRSS